MTMIEIVEDLYSKGYFLVPVHAVGPDGQTCTCAKGRNCPSPGKHPIQDGWTDPKKSREAFDELEAKGRRFNAGILVEPSGLLVVDIDPRNGGGETINELMAEHGELPKTRLVKTGGDGWHAYYRRPEGVDFKGQLGPGVDLKSTGMVVVEGSRSGSGSYSVMRDEPVVDPPEWVVSLGRRPKAEPKQASTEVRKVDPSDPDLPRRQAYCRSAVQREVARLEEMEKAKVPAGGDYRGEAWNNTTYQVACNLLEFANTPEAGMSHQDVVDIVLAKAPRDDGFGEDEITKILESAQAKVGDQGRDLPAPPVDPFPTSGDAGSRAGTVVDLEPIDRMDGRLWKDSHVAAAFAEHHAREIRYINGLGWFRYLQHEGRWKAVDDGTVRGMSDIFAQDLVIGAARRGDPQLSKSAAGRLSGGAINMVESIAKNIPALREEVESLDGDKELLNCTNGYVDLRTGELLPHNPDKMMSKSTGVAYRPDATHPDIDKALECLDPEEREWLQMVFGQAVTGYLPPEDFLTFFHGVGANGKTALIGTLRRVVGTYGVTMSERVIIANDQAHPTELTDLLGARVAVLEELPEGGNLSSKRIKSIAGTESMTARKMRQDSIQWEPTHTVFITTNHRPRITETDHGLWRRLVLLTFPYRFVPMASMIEGDRDRVGDIGLRHRLSQDEQKEAFLAWVVAGAVKYLARGAEHPLGVTERMQADIDDWRGNSDPLGRFLDERIEFDPESCITSAEFYDELKGWLVTNGHTPWSSQLVTTRLEGHHAAMAHNVSRKRVRVGQDVKLSYAPSPVTHSYADGQQVRVWSGMKWRSEP